MLKPTLTRLTAWLGDVAAEALRSDLEEVGAGPPGRAELVAVAGAVLFVVVALLAFA